ncbi:MAG: alpha/beta fold hydrolase [Gallionellaceae bacterium]|nr:alpha/beta fold hydrolase [Gallionellaceae bacterium]
MNPASATLFSRVGGPPLGSAYSAAPAMPPPSHAPCMLLHGLASSPREFSSIRNTLLREGVAIHTPELPDYSATGPMRPHSWRNWLASGQHELQRLSDREGPVVLGGLCIGAVLALALALANPKRVAGLVLLSPTLYYDGWGLSRLLHLRHIGYLPGLRHWIKVPEQEPYGVKNPQIRKWIAREMRERHLSGAGASHLPLWAIHEAERLIRRVRLSLAKIDTPTLILHAREDEVTSLRGPELLMRQLATTDKRMVVLENSYHMITLDNDRHTVVAEITRFTRRMAGNEANSPILNA